jgi:shikimate dehydrogenase
MGIPYAEVIGDPIAHSKSPLIHNFWLKKLGLEGEFRAIRVRTDELGDYLASRRSDPDWRGCNVTMPLKRVVEAHLDFIDPSSEWAGSTNCVFWDDRQILAGGNTDASGIVAALDSDATLRFQAATIIGAGAAAQAALWTLSNDEIGHVRIIARDYGRADLLLRSLGLPGCVYGFYNADEAVSGAAVIINASPLGMSGFPPMPETILQSLGHSSIDAIVFDMVYDPLVTELLTQAERYGRRTSDGLTMLIEQARDSFRHFFEGDPPSEHNAELRKLLSL